MSRADGKRSSARRGAPGTGAAADPRSRADAELEIFQEGVLAGLDRARGLPLDAHLHTTLSPDADVPIDVYASFAVERGIRELAITDHVDFDPRAPAYAFASFSTRERDVRDAAERWAATGLAIRFGVEVTYERRYEAEIRGWLLHHPHDFTIGSVHIGHDSPYRADRVAAFATGRPLRDVVEPYFDEVLAAAGSGMFDALGHLDFVKRYLAPHVRPADLEAAIDLYDPILRALVDGGTALEVNVSGLRQLPRETYPSAAVVARYRELGGRHVTIGSDAHRSEWFAYGLGEGYRLVEAAGYGSLTFRRGGDRVAVALR
jgi:histidinol-phosphatase (PHP family)